MDRHSRISVRTHCYSVPAHYTGRRMRAVLHANGLAVQDGATKVARHERRIAKGGQRLVLDHSLEALVRKPATLPGGDRARTGQNRREVHPGSQRRGRPRPAKPAATGTAPGP